jgi:nucleoid DNA-binding protein
MAKTTAIKEKYTKVQLIDEIATNTELSKKQVKQVFEELEALMARHLSKRAVGEFAIPSLFKVTTVRKKATKARKGINPFTGEPTVFKAKPARTVVKMRPLKKVKDMVL